MGSLWYFYDVSMIFLWDFCWIPVGFLLDSCGISIGFLWVFQGNFHDVSMICLWDYYGNSYGISLWFLCYFHVISMIFL